MSPGKEQECLDLWDGYLPTTLPEDTRSVWEKTCYITTPAELEAWHEQMARETRALILSQTSGSQTTPIAEAVAEEPPQFSINSDHDSARLTQTAPAHEHNSGHDSAPLSQTTPAHEHDVPIILPTHFPQFRHVQSHKELGSYIDRMQYAICVGSAPLDASNYGVIIVPAGEEHMLFRCEHVSGEFPVATQTASSLRPADEVQPMVVNWAAWDNTKVIGRRPPQPPSSEGPLFHQHS